MRRRNLLFAASLHLGISWVAATGAAQSPGEQLAPPVVVADGDAPLTFESTPDDPYADDEFVSTLEMAPDGDPKAAAAAKKKKADLKKAVGSAYAPLFYNNKFDYLYNPLYEDFHFGEGLKRNCLGDCWTYDVGGQYRARYHGERNHRRVGLTGLDDDFLLHRTRLYGNLQRGDELRVYAEFIDAESNYENIAPRGIEVNRADMLNLFGDLKVWDGCCGDLKVRVGRQELLYGSERLVSPLDWSNTRRTFEGVKAFWQGQDWNVDAFFTRPVIVDPYRFDSADYRQEFMGLWTTYKAIQNQTVDFYALQYNNASGTANFQYTTLGSRWSGSQDALLWDFEGGVQFGENTNGSTHQAGFATAGVGRKFEDHCWKPTVWAFYDWASAGEPRGAGNGFNHLFPLGHKYLGFMDLYGRSNIQTPNLMVQAQPHAKWKTTIWYYYFLLDSVGDSPYNITMAPYNAGNAPTSRHLGQELDLNAVYSINPRMDIMLGYSHFFAGDYYKTTPGVAYRDDADFFYTQFQWNF